LTVKKVKPKLDLTELFKILSNQKRLEILMAIFDNCKTASEIAKVVDLDISTVYRYLLMMKRAGILKSHWEKGVERFDFYSEELYKILEHAISFLEKVNNPSKSLDTKGYLIAFSSELLSIQPDLVLDLRGEVCPVPDIVTQRKLAEMEDGQVLMVIVDYPLSAERIPSSAEKLGHVVLGKMRNAFGETSIYIRCRRKDRG